MALYILNSQKRYATPLLLRRKGGAIRTHMGVGQTGTRGLVLNAKRGVSIALHAW